VATTDIPDDKEVLKAALLETRAKLSGAEAMIEHLQLVIAKMKRAMFGPRSERSPTERPFFQLSSRSQYPGSHFLQPSALWCAQTIAPLSLLIIILFLLEWLLDWLFESTRFAALKAASVRLRAPRAHKRPDV
jgi:hypothetical protein